MNAVSTSSTIRKLSLYASVPLGLLLSQADLGYVAEPKRELLEPLWKKASQAYSKLGGPTRSFSTVNDLMAIDGTNKQKVESVLKQMRLYPVYDSHPIGVYNVRLSKLVSPQLLINQKRAERRADVKPNMTSSELFDVVADPPKSTESVTKQVIGMTPDNGAVLFTTDNEDVRPHTPTFRKVRLNEKDEKSPDFDGLAFPVGTSFPPAANVFRIRIDNQNSRLIINNGVHRLFALAAKGNQWCPLVVTDIDAHELPDPFVDFTRDALLSPQQNPPMLADFRNNQVAIPLEYFPMKNTIKINFSIERYFAIMK